MPKILESFAKDMERNFASAILRNDLESMQKFSKLAIYSESLNIKETVNNELFYIPIKINFTLNNIAISLNEVELCDDLASNKSVHPIEISDINTIAKMNWMSFAILFGADDDRSLELLWNNGAKVIEDEIKITFKKKAKHAKHTTQNEYWINLLQLAAIQEKPEQLSWLIKKFFLMKKLDVISDEKVTSDCGRLYDYPALADKNISELVVGYSAKIKDIVNASLLLIEACRTLENKNTIVSAQCFIKAIANCPKLICEILLDWYFVLFPENQPEQPEKHSENLEKVNSGKQEVLSTDKNPNHDLFKQYLSFFINQIPSESSEIWKDKNLQDFKPLLSHIYYLNATQQPEQTSKFLGAAQFSKETVLTLIESDINKSLTQQTDQDSQDNTDYHYLLRFIQLLAISNILTESDLKETIFPHLFACQVSAPPKSDTTSSPQKKDLCLFKTNEERVDFVKILPAGNEFLKNTKNFNKN